MMCFSAWPQKILAIEWSTVRHTPSVVRHTAWYELNSVRVGPARLWIARWAEVSFSSPVFFVFQKKRVCFFKITSCSKISVFVIFPFRYDLHWYGITNKWLWFAIDALKKNAQFNYDFLSRILVPVSLNINLRHPFLKKNHSWIWRLYFLLLTIFTYLVLQHKLIMTRCRARVAHTTASSLRQNHIVSDNFFY